ncbi:MAG TPA: hypothetical protein VMD28_06700, partial [Acidimicrobiales bacterium]|nr:hypothetical protein [Acidimicrobiales bacterium]
NQSITSPTGGFRLVMQGDGNLVEYQRTGAAVWAAGTDPTGSDVVMQGDGNLVVYSATNAPLWASNTSGHPGAFLTLADSGQLEIVEKTGEPLSTW